MKAENTKVKVKRRCALLIYFLHEIITYRLSVSGDTSFHAMKGCDNEHAGGRIIQAQAEQAKHLSAIHWLDDTSTI